MGDSGVWRISEDSEDYDGVEKGVTQQGAETSAGDTSGRQGFHLLMPTMQNAKMEVNSRSAPALRFNTVVLNKVDEVLKVLN